MASPANGLPRHVAFRYKRHVTKRLTLDAHLELGRALKAALHCDHTRRGWIDAARCMLDDIVQCEYPRDELDLQDLVKLYYDDHTIEGERTDAYRAIRRFCELLHTWNALDAGYDLRYRTIYLYLLNKVVRWPQSPRKSI
jgi:hypothetical protein